MIVTVFLVHHACLRVLELGQLGHHLGHRRLGHLSLLSVMCAMQPTTDVGLLSYTPVRRRQPTGFVDPDGLTPNAHSLMSIEVPACYLYRDSVVASSRSMLIARSTAQLVGAVAQSRAQ
ncbi:hypothetical protein [Streptomyces sp900116325]|uniref:hypothetical protein n=1 Tax=Streptomyces sp. 900116325 TaxID=3154295 RepID=UPI0033AD4391